MSQPPAAQSTAMGRMHLVVFALLLLVPLLNFEFTFYPMALKLFVFQTTATVLWGYLLWQWAVGRLGAGQWPAYWLFLPLGLWVAWGVLTALWSPHGWLAGTWLVQGFYGAAGALGLAVLLRHRAVREVFVAAASAVVFVVALFMLVVYGQSGTTFFGDLDIPAREAGAAFLLIPTLVAAAVLYGRAGEDDAQGYKRVLWTAAVLLALLAAGLRTRSTAWVYGVGAGVAVALWLLAPRWRLAAVCLAVVLVAAVAYREAERRRETANILSEAPLARYAVFDRAEWALVGSQPWWRLAVGRGVGSFFVPFDHHRGVATYAMRSASRSDDVLKTHPRRELTEVLFERGVVGLGLAVAAGLACVWAGVLALRRAGDGGDASLGGGLAAGVVALGVFACFSNGAIGFGASMAFWVALGLLGALSVLYGRAAALGLSAEEAASQAEAAPRLGRAAPAAVLGVVAVAAWVVLGVRPFLAEYHLREAEGELDTAQFLRRLERRLPAEAKKRGTTHQEAVQATRRSLRRAAALSLGARVWLNARVNLARCDGEFGEPRQALQRYGELEALCGAGFLNFDVLQAEACLELGSWDRAHEHCRRYATKNPFACPSALHHASVNVYEPWLMAILAQRSADGQLWRQWGHGLIDAASRALGIDPQRYMLRMFRGDMRYRLSRDDLDRAIELRKPLDAGLLSLGTLALRLSHGLPAVPDRDLLLLFHRRTYEGLDRAEHYAVRADELWAQARGDLQDAAQTIHAALAEPHAPLKVAMLLNEYANACLHWDKQRALRAALGVPRVRADPNDPRFRIEVRRARRIVSVLAPPRPQKEAEEQPARGEGELGTPAPGPGKQPSP
ncbi:MAG: hypothetical protein ACLF0G_17580 [Candidatus Brocadiia bacterium]